MSDAALNKTASKRPRHDDGEDSDADANLLDAPIAGPSKKPSKALKKSSKPTPGIVYISRLPPGMTPHKVKHLMGRWGEIGRVYAQRRDAPTGYDPNAGANASKKKKHMAANFSEAWVEFMEKGVAKTVAEMLNAQVIGGKKGDRWRDDIWTMKYLSGFRWEMLGEQMAYERQAHQARLRNEIARSKTEQTEYLKNVELARVLNKRAAKKAGGAGDDTAAGAGGSKASGAGAGANGGDGTESKGARKYKQREAVDRAKGLEQKGMESVLGSIFG